MADLPAREDIDAMVELIGGPKASFENLSPADRIAIVGLVNQADLIGEIAAVKGAIEDLDHELTKVGDWFKNSRLYEG